MVPFKPVRFVSVSKRSTALIAAILLSSLSSLPDAQVRLSSDRTTVAGHNFYPEVRLRKLHLVRPDLIPYPIFYDIYC